MIKDSFGFLLGLRRLHKRGENAHAAFEEFVIGAGAAKLGGGLREIFESLHGWDFGLRHEELYSDRRDLV